MRILILHNFYQHLGGEDIVVQNEAKALVHRGHVVKILTKKNSKGLKGLKQYLLYPWNIFTANNLLREVEEFAPDIIHIHNLHYSIGPTIIRKLKKKNYPVVMTLHNFRLICPSATLFSKGRLFTDSLNESFPVHAIKNKVLDNSFIKTFITGFTYWFHKKIDTWNLIDKYFTFSDFSRQIFVESKLNIPREKFIIKPNFIHEQENLEREPANYYVYIGRLSEEKGILPLLKAFSLTSHTLKIFGSGPQEEEVKEYAEKYPNIKYFGFQEKDILKSEIQNANALIVPSVCYEGMPMNIIESFAIGTPVLCSNIGILSQMIVPLQTGLHFDPYSTESIVYTLEKWHNIDNSTKETISENCKIEFQNKYTEAKSIAILEDVYQQIIK